MDAWLVAYQNMLDELEDSSKATSKDSVLSSSAEEVLLESTDPFNAAKEGEHKPSDAKAVVLSKEPTTEHNAQDGRLWLHGDLHLTPGNLFLRVKWAVQVPYRPYVMTLVLHVHDCLCFVQQTDWANPRSRIAVP